MDRIREALRLQESGHKQREIHRITGIARSSLQEYFRTAKKHQLTCLQAKSLSDVDLRSVFGKKTPGRNRKEAQDPNFKLISTELQSRKGVTLELLWQEWVAATGGGYSYSTLCRRYRDWCTESKVTMRHEYYGGEKLITDFAGEGLRYRLADRTTKSVQVFVAVLAASNRIYCEALESQKITPWIGAHTRAFEFFGGTTEAVIIDNLKSGVTKADRYEPELTRAFDEWAAHYGVTAMPTRAGKPRDKGKVEKAVQDVERWVLAPLRNVEFISVGAINNAMRSKLARLNSRRMQDYGCSRDELFERVDKPALRALPAIRFEIFEWKYCRVNLDYHVELDKHWYSVPFQLLRAEVQVKASERIVEIFHNNQKVASHARGTMAHRHTTDPSHMPAHHAAVKDALKPEGFCTWGKTVGPQTELLVAAFLAAPRYREQSYRSLLGVRRLADKYGNVALEKAAASANRYQIVSQRYIKKLLESSSLPEKNKPLVHKNVRGPGYYN